MIVVIILVAAMIATAVVSVIVCAVSIKTTEYEVPVSGIKGQLKIVCISDLHSWEYGKENRKLVGAIAAQKPDAIIIAGDMITRRASEKQVEKFIRLLNKLMEFATVYYATGNHEADYMAEKGISLLERVSATGAVALYDRFVDADIKGIGVRIGAAAGRYLDGSERDKVTLNMLREIGNTETPSIAVVHQPENILMQDDRCNWTADLYLCGHTHGGIWCIPGVGGVLAPSQGLFPKYDKGRFMIDNAMQIIINAGLAGYYFIPRMFNKPEICSVILTEKAP